MNFLGVIWALLGVSALLLNPILKLAPRGEEAIAGGLSLMQWVLLVGFAIFMLYSEGIRGFQKASLRAQRRVCE